MVLEWNILQGSFSRWVAKMSTTAKCSSAFINTTQHNYHYKLTSQLYIGLILHGLNTVHNVHIYHYTGWVGGSLH